MRNSEDLKTNPRGNELLDICKLNDIFILNGRTTGDIFGNYTCHNWNGSSVVDYFLTPNYFINRFLEFSIGKYIPWLSDHCIIKTTILFYDTLNRTAIENKDPIKVFPGFRWNETSKSKYYNGLKSQDVRNKINTLLNSKNINHSELAAGIKNILWDNTKTSNLRHKKVAQRQSQPWFDYECKNLKNNLNTVGNKLKKDPGNQTIREILFQEKRNFKKVITAKKRRYKENIISELDTKKHEGNQKEFWKIFNKISPKNKSDPVQPTLDDFFKYLKKTSNSSTHQEIPSESLENGPLDFTISYKELEDSFGKLKPGKACGIDDICNEMIISLVNIHPNIVLKLFNGVLQSGKPCHKDMS